MSAKRDLLREASQRILQNDPALAEMAKNLRNDDDLKCTARAVQEAMAPSSGALESLEPMDEDLALETIVQRVGRPVLLVQDGTYSIDDERLKAPDADIWKKRLFDDREVYESLHAAIPAIGRVELLNNSDSEWVGTGWLIDDDIIVTNRHVANVFGYLNGGNFVFKRGFPEGQMKAKLDFLQEYDRPATQVFFIKDILHIEPEPGPDIALLKIEQTNGEQATLANPLRLAKARPEKNQFVATIGYPAYDSRVPDQDLIEKFFGNVFNKKRLAPGQILREENDEILHDCSTLGGNSGSPVKDIKTGEVVGLHFSGLFLQENRAVSSRVIANILDKVRKGTTIAKPEIQSPRSGASSTQPVCGISDRGSLDFQIPLNIQISLGAIANGLAPMIAARVISEAESKWDEVPTPSASPDIPNKIASLAVPLTPEQFLELVDNPSTTEADLAPYFIEDENRTRGMAPGFRINEGMVVTDPSQPALESALLLNGANGYCKMLRQRRYVQQIKDSSRPGATKRIRVVAEGDSWFEYPFILYDIVDHLMDRPEIAVFCCSEAGDTISSMLPKGEFYVPLQRENASVFLFSGGGNDIVDGHGLRRFLEAHPAGRDPKDYFNADYRSFMNSIREQYETLFTRVLRQQPSVHIICHGYSDAVPQPTKGKWLGKPMTEIGITDANLQQSIVQIIMGDLNGLLAGCAKKFGREHATYVDLRGIVPASGWHDEFHPTSDYFGKVAAPIYHEILKHG